MKPKPPTFPYSVRPEGCAQPPADAADLEGCQVAKMALVAFVHLLARGLAAEAVDEQEQKRASNHGPACHAR
jgi:hypothetical protein